MGIDAQMFLRTKNPEHVTPEFLRAAERRLFSLFGADAFDLWDDKHGLLSTTSRYVQDGPILKPRKDEKFIVLQLSTRYYGEGYERGDFRLIHDVAEAPGGHLRGLRGLVRRRLERRLRHALRRQCPKGAARPLAPQRRRAVLPRQ